MNLNCFWGEVNPKLIKYLVLNELNVINKEYAEKYELLCGMYSVYTAYEMILELLTDKEKTRFKKINEILAMLPGDK